MQTANQKLHTLLSQYPEFTLGNWDLIDAIHTLDFEFAAEVIKGIWEDCYSEPILISEAEWMSIRINTLGLIQDRDFEV